MFIKIPQDCVDHNDGRRPERTKRDIGRSRETDNIKSVVCTADLINSVLRTVRYVDVVKGNVLLCEPIDAHTLNIFRLPT